MSLPEVSLSNALFAGGVIIASGILQVIWSSQKRLKLDGRTPGLRVVVGASRTILNILPVFKIPFTDNWHFNQGPNFFVEHNWDVFEHYGQGIISSIPIDGSPTCYFIGDSDAVQEIMANRHKFPKPIQSYAVLNLYGHNVVTVEGEEWRVHRKITAPSFTENSNRLVCVESVAAMQGLFDLWKHKESVQFDDFSKLMMQLALIIICGAGFGVRVPWEDTAPAPGYRQSFKNAVELVSGGLMLKVILPDIAMNLSKQTAAIEEGFVDLKKYINGMISERSAAYQDHNDLFSNLLAANAQDNEGLKLTNDELIGNIFIFLIAGHETTAHTLAFCAAFLAIYPEVQERLFDFVEKNVADPSGAPTFAELPTLNYVLGVFYETLRHFAPVIIIPKTVTEDCTLKTTNRKGDPVIVPIRKGSIVNVVPPAMHHDPKLWEDPKAFKPERFLGAWPKHAFAPFSLGARSCMGRRFAEVEAVVILCMLARNWRFKITEDPKFAGESFEQRKARVLRAYTIITQTPYAIPITLERRK